MKELVSGKRKAPRLLLGGGPGFAVRAADVLRGMGWDVCSAAAGNDLGTLAARKNPAAVLLPVETAGESGYLLCAKLRLTRPKLKVVLVGEPTERAQRLARFVGAGLATEATAADAVLKLI
jgi:DNA-binding response OmpR family regulator